MYEIETEEPPAMLWISCGHTTPPLVRVSLDGYTYEVCGGRRCQALLPERSEPAEVEPVTVPFAPYDKRLIERELVAA
jgi:hypothetical protein